MYTTITGAILSGGKCARMGANKSFLRIGDVTVIEHTAALMSSIFSKVLISTNSPEEYSFLSLPCVTDIIKRTGPLAGIHSILKDATTDKVFIISCDLPLMTKDVIEFIVDYPTAKPICVAQADGFVQQLCGVYNKSLIPVIEQLLQSSVKNNDNTKERCSVSELVHTVQGEIINIETVYPNYLKSAFYNMNKPEDYEYVKSVLAT